MIRAREDNGCDGTFLSADAEVNQYNESSE